MSPPRVMFRSSYSRGVNAIRFRQGRWQYSPCHDEFFIAEHNPYLDMIDLYCAQCNAHCYRLAIKPPVAPVVFEQKVSFQFRMDRLFFAMMPEGAKVEELFLNGQIKSTEFCPVFLPRDREGLSWGTLMDFLRLY